MADSVRRAPGRESSTGATRYAIAWRSTTTTSRRSTKRPRARAWSRCSRPYLLPSGKQSGPDSGRAGLRRYRPGTRVFGLHCAEACQPRLSQPSFSIGASAVSDFYERLGSQLVQATSAALTRRSTVDRPRRRRRRLALALCAAVVAVSSTAAATGTWQPVLGRGGPDGPKPATTPVPGDQAALLGILRRPQLAEDRGVDVEQQLKGLMPEIDRGIRLDYVRRLAPGAAGHGAVVLIPKESFGEAPPAAARRAVRDALCVYYPTPRGPEDASRRRSPAGGQSRFVPAEPAASLPVVTASICMGSFPMGSLRSRSHVGMAQWLAFRSTTTSLTWREPSTDRLPPPQRSRRTDRFGGSIRRADRPSSRWGARQ